MTAPPHLIPRRHVHDARSWTWNSELAIWIGRCSCGFPFPASIEQARALERTVGQHLAGLLQNAQK